MGTLINEYENLLKSQDKWCYYKNETFVTDKYTFEKTIFTCPADAYKFIEWYFEIGGKASVLYRDNYTLEKYLDNERVLHVVSTFFLGIYIAQALGIDISLRDHKNMDFRYYWFLTALYHDMGYYYEKNSSHCQLMDIKLDGIEGLKRILGVDKIDEELVFLTYSKLEVESYLRYRTISTEKHSGKIDHGIAGGLMIYDALDKMFKKSWNLHKQKKPHCQTKENFSIKKGTRMLHVSSNHYEAYGKLADGIIAHNMWTSQFEKCDPVIETKAKISIENTILFILALADTLEPAKREPNLLSSITIENVANGVKLCMSQDAYCSVYKSAIDLCDWVDVDVIVKRFGEKAEIEVKKGEY